MAVLRVRQIKSEISENPKRCGTLRALGLRGVGRSNTLPDRPEINGMLKRVPDLVEVEVAPGEHFQRHTRSRTRSESKARARATRSRERATIHPSPQPAWQTGDGGTESADGTYAGGSAMTVNAEQPSSYEFGKIWWGNGEFVKIEPDADVTGIFWTTTLSSADQAIQYLLEIIPKSTEYFVKVGSPTSGFTSDRGSIEKIDTIALSVSADADFLLIIAGEDSESAFQWVNDAGIYHLGWQGQKIPVEQLVKWASHSGTGFVVEQMKSVDQYLHSL